MGTATSDPSPRKRIVKEISNFAKEKKNEAEIRRDGSTHALVYSKAHPPNVGAGSSAEIIDTSLP